MKARSLTTVLGILEKMVPSTFSHCRIEGTDREPQGLCEVLLRNDWKISPEGCYVAVNSQGQVISMFCLAMMYSVGTWIH